MSVANVHLFLAEPDVTPFLADEIRRAAAGVTQREIEGVGIGVDADMLGCRLAFARQTLPDAVEVGAVSINAWADRIIEAVAGVFPDGDPWRLHIWPGYGVGRAGENRCELIRAAVVERLKKRRRHLLRSLEESETVFDEKTSLAQCFLSAPDAGWLSACRAPDLNAWRHLVACFPRGHTPWEEDKSAPSRAFAKLVEAEARMGRRIEKGETCVDLGAAPGSWSYVALQRGARVIAVDRSELREDLMRNPGLRLEIADAFKFRPERVVDWLVCDVIAAPQRSIDLLLEWLRERRMRNFVVTIKFKGFVEYGVLETLKRDAPSLCADFYLTRLCANKNEVCAFGTV
ncbi:MAG: SAM-dependent methyltransferase [Prosthecobacter sp.]